MSKKFSMDAISLGDRAKSTARKLGLDVNDFGARHVGERIVTELPFQIPFCATGGLTFAHNLRETKDVDLVTVRRISARDMRIAFEVMAPRLAREGITLVSFAREAREMNVGLPNPVDRWSYVADCGTIRANSSIDLSWQNGPNSIWANESQSVRWVERPGMINGTPAFRSRVLVPAASAAEKLLAVVMQPTSDTRCKHLADVVNGNLWDDIDCRQVAAELRRVMAHRGISMDVATEHPDALRWTNMVRLEPDWLKSRNAKRTELTLDQAWIDVTAIWRDVHAELRAEVIRDFRRSDYNPSIVDRLLAPGRRREPFYKPF